MEHHPCDCCDGRNDHDGDGDDACECDVCGALTRRCRQRTGDYGDGGGGSRRTECVE